MPPHNVEKDADCRIELLGGLRPYVDGRLARVEGRKTGSLLAYLAFYKNRSHSREQLAEMFWPEADSPRNSLKTDLTRLRQSMGWQDGNGPLHGDRHFVWLDGESVATDVAEFEQEILAARRLADPKERAAGLTGALALYAGDLLPDEYAEWVEAERQRLRRLCLEALRLAITARQETGELEEAVSLARRALQIEPLDEDTHCALMRLFLRQGKPSAALLQYRDLQQVLREGLEVEPGLEARALAEEAARSPAAPTTRSEPGDQPRPIRRRRTADLPPLEQPQAAPADSAPPAPASLIPRSPRRRPITIAALLAFALVFGLTALNLKLRRHPAYTIQEIEPLFGDDTTIASAINDAGLVVGYSHGRTGNHAIVYDSRQGIRALVPRSGFVCSVAYAVNDAGLIVGSDEGTGGKACVWQGAQAAQRVPGFPAGSIGYADGVNARGQITGQFSTNQGFRAWFYDPVTGFRSLGALHNTQESGAGGMNTRGFVVGQSDSLYGARGFLWDGRQMQILDPVPGGGHSSAISINDRQVIVGECNDVDGLRQPMLWDLARKPHELPTPSGLGGCANTINAAGVVAGYYDAGHDTKRAFVWDSKHGSRDLNDLIPADTGWVLENAVGINARGQIIGTGRHYDKPRAFLLTPLSQ